MLAARQLGSEIRAGGSSRHDYHNRQTGAGISGITDHAGECVSLPDLSIVARETEERKSAGSTRHQKRLVSA